MYRLLDDVKQIAKNRIHIVTVPSGTNTQNSGKSNILEHIHDIPADKDSFITTIAPLQDILTFMNHISAVGNSRKSLPIALKEMVQTSMQLNTSDISNVSGLFI